MLKDEMDTLAGAGRETPAAAEENINVEFGLIRKYWIWDFHNNGSELRSKQIGSRNSESSDIIAFT